MALLREQLMADCGGAEQVSTAKGILIDLAVAAAMRVTRTNAYIATMRCQVDRRHRREWPVVEHVRRAEAHLQSLLCDIGLQRRAQPVPSLPEFIRAQEAEAQEGEA